MTKLTDYTEIVYERLESKVPGAAREREVGEFYRWRTKDREAQLFCLNERTIALIDLRLGDDQAWVPVDVRKEDITEIAPGDLAGEIAELLSA